MNYTSNYDRINWQNTPSVSTPINAANLNKMDSTIDALDSAMEQVADLTKGSRVFNLPVDSVVTDKIYAYIGDTSIGAANDLLIVNTLDHMGTTSSSWTLRLTEPVPGGVTKDYALKDAEGLTTYSDDVDANTMMFIRVGLNNVAYVVGVFNSINIDFPLAINKGGTGNIYGLVQAGHTSSAAIGDKATAEGSNNEVTGDYAHAEGYGNSVAGDYAHANGVGNVAGHDYQTAIGKYNANHSDTLFEVGNGTGNSARSNALEVTASGHVKDGLGNDMESLSALEATASGNPIVVNAQDVAAKGLKVRIEPIQSGSGDPSPTNIRPISGRTEVNLGRTGKNLLPMILSDIKADNTTGTWNGNAYTIEGVTFYVLVDSDNNVIGIATSGVSTARAFINLCYRGRIWRPATGNYIVSKGYTNQYTTLIVEGYNGNTWAKSIARSSGVDDTSFTIDYDGYDRVSVVLEISSGINVNNLKFYPMIRDAAESDPTFAPYKGSVTLTIALGTTVYGGTLDVKTGVLTIDQLGHIFDGTEVITVLDNRFVYNKEGASSLGNNDYNCISSHYPAATNLEVYNNRNTEGYIGMCANGSALIWNDKINYPTNDVTAYKAYLAAQYAANTPVTAVWKLATPTTVQLTPAQLELLKGYNYITADGNIDLVYVPESISGLMEEVLVPISLLGTNESGNTKASRAYTSGEYFYQNGKMYKATTSIASGATFTVGTNCVQTTLFAELKAAQNA